VKRIILAVAMGVPLLAQTVEVKTAEQVYKNITALKGTPADQLMPAMQFMSASLGVTCDTCHVAGKFDADDKRAKKTAREMIAMTMMINQKAFNAQLQVSCYSCHRGSERPVPMPSVMEADAAMAAPEPRPAAPANLATPPTADAILDKYITVLGGADNIRKITSRAGKGTISVAGKESPVEVYTKAPNLRVTVTHNGGNASYTGFDGKAGWMGNTGRAPREMSPAESMASGLDAEFALALRMKEIFPQVRAGRPDKIGETPVVSLTGTRPGQPPVRFFFDANSGLLVRMVRSAETPVGRMPTQIDYSDYREIDGIQVPCRWTLSRPNGRFTIHLTDVKQNVPVDDAKFVKPAGEVK
jgi:photosynthetic reaction center cytochrome c subunit